MKHFRTRPALIGVMAAVAALSVSCQKDDSIKAGVPDGGLVPLCVNVRGEAMTKATLNEQNEQVVRTVEVFVFNNDSKKVLDAYGKSTDGSTINVNCTTGPKVIYALVNSKMSQENLASIQTLSDLLSTETFLGNCDLSSFEMIGSVEKEVSAGTTVSIDVSRMVARVGIGSIRTDFMSPYYRNAEFKVKRIYMINAVTHYNYGMDKVLTAADFTSLRKDAAQLTDFLSCTKNVTIANKGTSQMNEYFYLYPNTVTIDKQDSSDDPRKTRLVVEASLDGKTCYYSITIESEDGMLHANKAYTIGTLTITRPGSSSPDQPLDLGSGAFSIQVANWDSAAADKSI